MSGMMMVAANLGNLFKRRQHARRTRFVAERLDPATARTDLPPWPRVEALARRLCAVRGCARASLFGKRQACAPDASGLQACRQEPYDLAIEDREAIPIVREIAEACAAVAQSHSKEAADAIRDAFRTAGPAVGGEKP